DVLLRGEFGKYLMKNELLGSYLIVITYMHAFQMFAALAAAIGLVSVLIDNVPLWVDRTIFSVALTLTVYALKQAFGAVTAMNDLLWQAAYYELNRQSAQAPGGPIPFRGI